MAPLQFQISNDLKVASDYILNDEGQVLVYKRLQNRMNDCINLPMPFLARALSFLIRGSVMILTAMIFTTTAFLHFCSLDARSFCVCLLSNERGKTTSSWPQNQNDYREYGWQ